MSREKTVRVRPCPFCGGRAIVVSELNCDTLYVEHAPACFAQSAPLKRYHWNDPEQKLKKPFSDWNMRAKARRGE
jgi:hypothetical protein